MQFRNTSICGLIAGTLACWLTTAAPVHAVAPHAPSAPINLTATPTSTADVTLRWADTSNNEAGFRIEMATSSSGPWQKLAIIGANKTSFTKSGLKANSTYYFRVRAGNLSGVSAFSNIAAVTTRAGAPTAPSSLSVSATSTSQMNLKWVDNAGNETGFDVETSSSSSGPWTVAASVSSATTSYAASGLSAGRTYYYRVRAKNLTGYSGYSNVASGTTQSTPTTPPPPPTSTNVSAVAASKGIYMLDDRNGTYRLASIRQADKPFVDGYVWRMGWTDFDTGTTGPEYHLDATDAAVSALQALANNKNNRMKLSLGMYALEVPAYALNAAQETYAARLFGDNGTAQTPVPWDATAQTYFRNFIQALASHPVYDAVSGTNIAFRDHPALGQIVAPIIGQQWYRDQGDLSTLSSYTRAKYIQSVLDCIHIVRDAFPNKPVYVGFFSLTDDQRTPSLDSDMLDALTNEFDGVKNPRVAVFQELLRGDAPSTAGSYGKNLLTARAGGCPVMFQACSPWINKSLCTFTPGDDTPENGFDYGYNTFGTLYYEMYTADLSEPSWTTMFQQWHDFLQAQ